MHGAEGSQPENLAMPFYSAHCPSLGHLFYFRVHADATAFHDLRGGYILETTPGRIWRVTLADAIDGFTHGVRT